MSNALEVTGVRGVAEPEPGIVEITVEVGDNSSTVLRMSLLTFLRLWVGVKHLASPAEPLTDDKEASAETSSA